MNSNRQPTEPLPEEAAAALHSSGARLLAQLEMMRAEAGAAHEQSVELEPLDPQADLALRRNGDALLAYLDAQRGTSGETAEPEPELTSSIRWIWRRGAGIAAVLAGLLALVQFNTAPPQDAVKPAVRVKKHDPDAIPNAVVPEPSSALLGLVGGVFLLYRRRR